MLCTNPRGSTGYGAAFAAANKNDLGGGDYQDIMAGVDTVLAKYPLDPNKMALIGYSYGGEMAGFIEGKTDRFKAIVSGAPVIDQESEYGTEDGSWYDRWFYGGYPWEHAADAWRQSPLAYVAHAKTPFLLLQGEADSTDPSRPERGDVSARCARWASPSIWSSIPARTTARWPSACSASPAPSPGTASTGASGSLTSSTRPLPDKEPEAVSRRSGRTTPLESHPTEPVEVSRSLQRPMSTVATGFHHGLRYSHTATSSAPSPQTAPKT